jgi:hypothetical protein
MDETGGKAKHVKQGYLVVSILLSITHIVVAVAEHRDPGRAIRARLRSRRSFWV